MVVSDVHLCDVEEHADGWKAYKSARHLVDRELANEVADFIEAASNDEECIVVLNGDIVDFDLVTETPEDPPWPVSRAERRRGMDATESKSVWKLERILQDHPIFLDMLVRVLGAGHRVVYVMGNHDMEFHFDAVKQALLDAIAARARATDSRIELGRFAFEPWFFHVPGEIYVEHGQQYDYYTSFRHILAPTIPGRPEPTLALPMGNLSNRELITEMGFFNPHASNYILNVYRYVAHWLRHYAFSRRNIATRWFIGSLVVLSQLLRTKGALKRRPPDHRGKLREFARDRDLPLETVHALYELQAKPITNRWYRVVREFWIDRLIVAILMVAGTVALVLSPIALWAKFVVPLLAFPLLFLIYEWFAHGDTIFSAESRSVGYARSIASLVSTQVVVFGHSHTPMALPAAPGVTYVNTGTWAPIWEANDEPAPGLRNVLVVRFDKDVAQISLRTTT